jgi:hypothetical protein
VLDAFLNWYVPKRLLVNSRGKWVESRQESPTLFHCVSGPDEQRVQLHVSNAQKFKSRRQSLSQPSTGFGLTNQSGRQDLNLAARRSLFLFTGHPAGPRHVAHAGPFAERWSASLDNVALG